MSSYFWVIESPRSRIDQRLHRHIIFRFNRPEHFLAGPFPTENKAQEWLNANGKPGDWLPL
jgi:hypothetical protein